MWRRDGADREIGVPHQMAPGSAEMRAVIGRLALDERRSASLVATGITAAADAAEALGTPQREEGERR
jgi:hypothetical protein